jgi:hypothetical protein
MLETTPEQLAEEDYPANAIHGAFWASAIVDE